ncbi:MAG: hypothetical protein OEQ29_04755 [Alphaproteobacteria bacterium]|nr:hypothetical protein [Alphaproteobacteria bacterium]
MLKHPPWALVAGVALLLTACQGDGPSQSAMEKAWLSWAGRQTVRDFEKISCKQAEGKRWFCRFRTRHRFRRGRRKGTLVANRSGYYQPHGGGWTYLGKLTGKAGN